MPAMSHQGRLNKSQTRALAKLNAVSESEFQRIVNPQPSSQQIEPSSDNQPSANRALSNFSATEIEAIANKEIQKEALAEQGRSRVMPSLSSEVKTLLLDSLGIPDERIAERLKINRKTVTQYCNNLRLFQSVRDSLDKGLSVSEAAKKHGCPEPLVWSLALEGKEDLQRFKTLNWGLRTWDLWNWNDCLPREIYVNNSEVYPVGSGNRTGAYFTGVTNVSEMIGPVVSRPK